MEKVIIIAGPTASGKSDLAVELALEVDGEVISADSMQIYREMDIGTAKPSTEERKGIPHHLIDIVNPDEEFSAAQFQASAKACIKDIISRGKVPVVAGGTGLYINTLVYNFTFSETTTDWEYRERLHDIASKRGPLYLYELLKEVDEKSAENIHPNNVKRVIRALEVFKSTGKPISEHQIESRQEPPPYDYKIFGLHVERDILYDRIEKRVDKMVESGLCKEVESILNKGYSPDLVSLQGIGYKEIIAVINGSFALSDAINEIKSGTRHLAKRQMTWFRKTEGLKWLTADLQSGRAMLKILVDALNVQD